MEVLFHISVALLLENLKQAFCEVQDADRGKITEKYLDVSELGSEDWTDWLAGGPCEDRHEISDSIKSEVSRTSV